jgi:hypothetical protein
MRTSALVAARRLPARSSVLTVPASCKASATTPLLLRSANGKVVEASCTCSIERGRPLRQFRAASTARVMLSSSQFAKDRSPFWLLAPGEAQLIACAMA